jgi:hypothetical protein
MTGICIMKIVFIGIFIICNMFKIIRAVVRPIVKKQFLILNKSGKVYSDERIGKFLNLNMTGFKDKKLVSISPGGFYGFYVMGVCFYIRENYSTSDCIFSGASAGAWNSLYMTFNKDLRFLNGMLVKNDLYANKNIFQIEEKMKNLILEDCDEDDFDLERLFIGVTNVGRTNIYTDFTGLEDALDCCIASSHIPFVTGVGLHRYKNTTAFDGGFSEYPYLGVGKSVLHITPSIWDKDHTLRYNLFHKKSFDFEKLFEKGYLDSKIYGKELLDKVFLKT